MAVPAYRLIAGSTTEAFHRSRKKFQFIGGGFGSGKTTAMVIKCLRIARDYPGSTGLLARATYPKLNSTLRREFFKWCPQHWIKNFNKGDNEVELVNGTRIDFRYIAQRNNTEGEGTSNLLSGNYDWIAVDQFDDPELTHKDFLDLNGRLRGSAAYVGDDKTMPSTGPRFFMFTSNPTRNWFYRKIIKPLHDYRQGLFNPDLLCIRGRDRVASVGTDGKLIPIIDVFESSTYDNAQNLPDDFISTLESAYSGQMYDRFLLGKWTAYEGAVYPSFDDAVHIIPHDHMHDYYKKLRQRCGIFPILESLDYGIAEPSCYLYAFQDEQGNTHIFDGFYEPGLGISGIASNILDTRTEYSEQLIRPEHLRHVLADPAIFRRNAAQIIGPSVASMLGDAGVICIRANNALLNGITKVQGVLKQSETRLNPYTGGYNSPRLFVSDKLHWWANEVHDYIWTTDKSGELNDKPRDAKNHAMDCTRYLLSNEPEHAIEKPIRELDTVPTHFTRWSEPPDQDARIA